MFKGQRRYLERLSTDELHTEALALGLDAPFGLDRVLLIDEMLDAGFTMEMETEEPSLRDAPFEEEPVPLPQRYNMTYIETVVRDPLWVFLYWELRESEKTLLESAPGFGGYLLRILRVNEKAELKEEGAAIEDAGTAAGAPLAEDANTTGGAYPAETEVLRVPINLSDSGWYLGRNEDNGKQAYIAQLCVLKDKKPRLLAASPRFKMPSLAGHENDEFAASHALVRLSGYAELDIVRDNDRVVRGRGAGSGEKEEAE